MAGETLRYQTAARKNCAERRNASRQLPVRTTVSARDTFLDKSVQGRYHSGEDATPRPNELVKSR